MRSARVPCDANSMTMCRTCGGAGRVAAVPGVLEARDSGGDRNACGSAPAPAGRAGRCRPAVHADAWEAGLGVLRRRCQRRRCIAASAVCLSAHGRTSASYPPRASGRFDSSLGRWVQKRRCGLSACDKLNLLGWELSDLRRARWRFGEPRRRRRNHSSG